MDTPQPLKGSSSLTVLVVDDDPAVRLLISATLGLDGIEVVEADGGERALSLLGQGQFDVILLDRVMPDLDGIEVLRRLRADPAAAHVPVILVTGVDDVTDRVEGLDVGADDYVTKPFEPEELMARVRAQLRGRSAWDAVVSRHVHERAVLLSAAGRAAVGGDPAAAASRLVEELLGLADVAGVTCLSVAAGQVSMLAAGGDEVLELRSSDAQSPALGRYLTTRAAHGAWLERTDHDHKPEAVAVAPIVVDAELVGLLLAVTAPGVRRAQYDWLLATTIDFAVLAGGVFGPALRDMAPRTLLRQHYLDVIAAEGFSVVFQPIVELDIDLVVGYEALTRFDDGTPPERAFPQAAAVGVGTKLELATLRAAIDGSTTIPTPRWLCVNVSPSLLHQEPEVAELADLVRRRRGLLVLELSEHERVDDYTRLRDAISRLGASILLSVDDAGSGFASLAHILALRAELVKLDQSWVRGIEHDPARQALVAGLQHFANETGANLIAEGIESPAELDRLQRLGVRYGQGFLLGRPAELP